MMACRCLGERARNGVFAGARAGSKDGRQSDLQPISSELVERYRTCLAGVGVGDPGCEAPQHQTPVEQGDEQGLRGVGALLLKAEQGLVVASDRQGWLDIGGK